jgi:diguanylate cyclase (GGDEF)-like protein
VYYGLGIANQFMERSALAHNLYTSETASHKEVAVTMLDQKTFIKVIDECRQLVKYARHHIEILAERNIGLQKDLTELVQKEAQTRHLAYHDELTGLPNRSLLQDRFQQAMSQAERHHKPLALLLLDLNRFKRVNDSLGHVSGDKLLQAVALRLTKSIRGADTACRYGGDEFVIMLPEIYRPNIVTALAVEISGRLSEPYIIDGHKIHTAASVGVAVYPRDGKTFEALMKQADIAMYRSKGTRHSTSITEQPKKDVGEAGLYTLPAPKNADRVRKRDLFIQVESAHTQEKQKKQQKM